MPGGASGGSGGRGGSGLGPGTRAGAGGVADNTTASGRSTGGGTVSVSVEQDGPATGGSSGANVGLFVSDHPRSRQLDIMLVGGFVQQVRRWLPTFATGAGSMRTDVGRGDQHTRKGCSHDESDEDPREPETRAAR